MPAKKKSRKQKTTPLNADPKRTSPQRDTVQRTVHNGKRELDNREYGEGYGASREAALRNPEPAEDQGADEGCADTVEGALKNFPEEPPPALFEANHLLDAAETFWGLPKGTIAFKGKGSRKTGICWPRYVVCKLLLDKGMTHEAIGNLLGNREHSTIHYSIKQYNAAVQTRPAYKRQAVEFERYCWNNFKGYPTKRYKVGSVIT